MENTDCNLSQLLSKAAITEAPDGGDVQVNAPAKYQPDPAKIPTGSKLPSGMVQVDEFIDFPLIHSKTPEVLIPARSGAKADQPNVKIGSSSNHAGFSFDRIEADSRRGFALILPNKGWEADEDDDEDDDDEWRYNKNKDRDLSQLLAMGPVKAYLVPEAPVPADIAGKPQPNLPEKYKSQIDLPSSSNPPSQTVNKDAGDDSEDSGDEGFGIGRCSKRVGRESIP